MMRRWWFILIFDQEIDIWLKSIFNISSVPWDGRFMKKSHHTMGWDWNTSAPSHWDGFLLLVPRDDFLRPIPSRAELWSRPYAMALRYEVQMEIIGFTDDNIAKYVKVFFNPITHTALNPSMETHRVLQFLQSNPIIWGVAHIPVNLELICTAWITTDWSKTKILTLTVLFDNMVEWLCKRLRQNKVFSPTKPLTTLFSEKWERISIPWVFGFQSNTVT